MVRRNRLLRIFRCFSNFSFSPDGDITEAQLVHRSAVSHGNEGFQIASETRVPSSTRHHEISRQQGRVETRSIQTVDCDVQEIVPRKDSFRGSNDLKIDSRFDAITDLLFDGLPYSQICIDLRLPIPIEPESPDESPGRFNAEPSNMAKQRHLTAIQI